MDYENNFNTTKFYTVDSDFESKNKKLLGIFQVVGLFLIQLPVLSLFTILYEKLSYSNNCDDETTRDAKIERPTKEDYNNLPLLSHNEKKEETDKQVIGDFDKAFCNNNIECSDSTSDTFSSYSSSDIDTKESKKRIKEKSFCRRKAFPKLIGIQSGKKVSTHSYTPLDSLLENNIKAFNMDLLTGLNSSDNKSQNSENADTQTILFHK